eukprot:3164964-Rhodomonas_salina.1
MMILSDHHDAPHEGHFGVDHTHNAIARLFYWQNMFADALASTTRSARPRNHALTAPLEYLILSWCPGTPGTQLGWTSWGRFQKPTPLGRKTTSWWSLTTSAKKLSSSPAAAHRATVNPLMLKRWPGCTSTTTTSSAGTGGPRRSSQTGTRASRAGSGQPSRSA